MSPQSAGSTSCTHPGTRPELRIPKAAAQTRIVSGGEFRPSQRGLSRYFKYIIDSGGSLQFSFAIFRSSLHLIHRFEGYSVTSNPIGSRRVASLHLPGLERFRSSRFPTGRLRRPLSFGKGLQPRSSDRGPPRSRKLLADAGMAQEASVFLAMSVPHLPLMFRRHIRALQFPSRSQTTLLAPLPSGRPSTNEQ
jgi:hypothetical protein